MEHYQRIINQDDNKGIQLRLVINEFRGVEYLHIRKYFLDFDGEWLASKEGVSMPLTIKNSKELLVGMLEIVSLAESKELIEEILGETLQEIYVK